MSEPEERLAGIKEFVTGVENWAADDGPFADNTNGAITPQTFRDFAAAVEDALTRVRLSLGMLLAEISEGSAPTPFHLDPDKPETGWVVPSKTVLDALEYEGDPWSTGQYIQLKNGRSYFWDGSAWASGQND